MGVCVKVWNMGGVCGIWVGVWIMGGLCGRMWNMGGLRVRVCACVVRRISIRPSRIG